MQTVEQACDMLNTLVRALTSPSDPSMDTVISFRNALADIYAEGEEDVPSIINKCGTPAAMWKESQRLKAKPVQETETDDVDFTIEEIVEHAKASRSSKGRSMLFPYGIKYEGTGVPRKASIAYNFYGPGKHLYAYIHVDGIYMSASEIANTGSVKERVRNGDQIRMHHGSYGRIEVAVKSDFVITIDTLNAIAKGKTDADVVRANADRAMTPLAPPAQQTPTDVKLEGTKFFAGESQVSVDPKTMVMNPTVVAHINSGFAKKCEKTDPHSACHCTFVHTTDMDTTWFIVNEELYRASDIVPNKAIESIRTGKWQRGRACANTRPHDAEDCMFIHIKEKAKPSSRTTRGDTEPAMTLAEYEKRREETKTSPKAEGASPAEKKSPKKADLGEAEKAFEED
jgi:hypothetical protein